METGDEVLRVYHKKDRIGISQFTKFEVLSLDCNHLGGSSFLKLEKLETLYGFGGCHAISE